MARAPQDGTREALHPASPRVGPRPTSVSDAFPAVRLARLRQHVKRPVSPAGSGSEMEGRHGPVRFRTGTEGDPASALT